MSYEDNFNAIFPAYAKHLFKYGSAISTTARKVIWDGATALYTGFIASENKVLVSSSSTDDGDGTAAENIVIIGQGDDGLEISDLITLSGSTPVLSNKLFKIIYRAYVFNSFDRNEDTGPNHGTITIYEDGVPLNIMARILPTIGASLMCVYKIPANQYGVFNIFRAFGASGKTTTIEIFLRYNVGRGNAWNSAGSVVIPPNGAPAVIDFNGKGLILKPGTEIIVTAKVDLTTGMVSADFDIELFDLLEDE